MSSTCVNFFFQSVNLTYSFQTQLAIDTNATVADTKTVVVGTQTMVADTQTKVSDTQAMIVDIHRKVLTGQEGTSGQNDSVSATSIYQHWNAYHRLAPRKVRETECYGFLLSYSFIESRLGNCLPRPRGAVSDATS